MSDISEFHSIHFCWIGELFAVFKNALLAFFPCRVRVDTEIDVLLCDTANTRNPQSLQMFMYELLRQTPPIFALDVMELKLEKPAAGKGRGG